MCKAMKAIAEKYSDADLVYPVHLNPNLRQPVNEILTDVDNVHLIEPCLLYTSPSPRDVEESRMPSSA